jgi:hypothetical protein
LEASALQYRLHLKSLKKTLELRADFLIKPDEFFVPGESFRIVAVGMFREILEQRQEMPGRRRILLWLGVS